VNRPVLKYIYLLILISSVLFAQQDQNTARTVSYEAPKNPLSISKSSSEISLIKTTPETKSTEEFYNTLKKQPPVILHHKNKVEQSFNIVSSFRSNIRFGGFWGKYAIINFTPQVFLKPAGFISIYARHSTSCFIPIEGIKEHMKMLCIQGAAVLAVDNTVKIFFGTEKMIPSIAGFIAKTLIINSVMTSINKNKKNKIFDYRSYYYSVSIRL